MKPINPVPFNEGYLKVDDIHNLYYHQYGNPQGVPALSIHGGPGSQSKAKHALSFNLNKYRVILFDQRGCGRSAPAGETRNNTTQELVKDIEKLRNHLGISKWHIYGPSWGSTLALSYAQSYPDKVLKMLLRGVFLGSKLEDEWLHKEGANMFFPEEWERLISILPEGVSSDITSYLYEVSIGDDKLLQEKLLPAFNNWEEGLLTLEPAVPDDEVDIESEINGAKIMLHYMKNVFFLEDFELLRKENISKITDIPITILNGRYDMITPPISAWKLHKKLPGSRLIVVTLAGHHGSDEALRTEVEKYLDFENWD